MRILHLLATPFWSGPAENVAQLALAQRALGHAVSVAIDRKRDVVAAEELAAPRFRALGLLDEHGLELSAKSLPHAMVRDVLKLRRAELDVWHSHFSHDQLIALAARKTRRGGVALVRSVHAPRSLRTALHANAFTVPFAALGESAKTDKPWGVMPALLDSSFHPPSDRTRLRSELKLSGAPLIGMVSTFQPTRRHALGIEAFAAIARENAEAKLILIGDGRLEPELRSHVATSGLDERVTFAGYQRGEQFVRWLQALDQVWILGLGNDFSGRAALQARACGVRVLAVDEGALSEWADVMVPVDAQQVASAARSQTRRTIELPSSETTARRVLELYERARVRR